MNTHVGLFIAPLFVAATALVSTATASQVAFDCTTDASHVVASWESVSISSGDDFAKYGIPYQPSRAESIDHLSVEMLGGVNGRTGNPPTEADWARLHNLWQIRM